MDMDGFTKMLLELAFKLKGDPLSFLVESTQSMIGILRLSATLQVAQFPRVSAETSLTFFDASYRQVLNEKVSDLLNKGHQVMVFVHSKKDTVKTAEKLVRVHAIRGLPPFYKDTPAHVSKIVDIVVQIFNDAEENVERYAVVKALLSLLRQDVKENLFTHIESSGEQSGVIREGTLSFIRDKSVQDVTGGELNMSIGFLKSLSIFGDKASPERIHELTEIIEGQSDLNAQFNRGASCSKFPSYPNRHILPDFDKECSLTAVFALLIGGNLYMAGDSKRGGVDPPLDVYVKVHWLSPTIAMFGCGSSRLYSAIKASLHFILQLQHQSNTSEVAHIVANYVRALLATGEYPLAKLWLILGGSHGSDENPTLFEIKRVCAANGTVTDVVSCEYVPYSTMIGCGTVGMVFYTLLHPLSTINISDPSAIMQHVVETVANSFIWSPNSCGPPVEAVFIPTGRLPASQGTFF